MVETDTYSPSDFVVPIVGMNEDGSCGPFLGSGVFATESAFLVTCDHVLEPWKGKYAVAIQELNRLFVAELLVRDEKHDLAALRVPEYRPPHCVPLEEDSEISLNKIVICYEYGTTVTAGKQIDFSPANRLGNVTRIRDLRDRFKSAGDHMLELSFPALKGASGAPVMDWRPPFKLWGLIKANVGYELLPAQVESVVDTTGQLSEETKFYLPQALAVHVKHVRQLLRTLSALPSVPRDVGTDAPLHLNRNVNRRGVQTLPDLSTIEQEIYTHEYLWRSASRLLEHAEANEEGSFYFLLPSLLTSYMAFEAFINFCGFVILPELWKDEKKNFKGKGIEGKLEKIVAELPGFAWRKGEAPYQKIRNLEDFRDIVSHGKVEPTQYVAERKEDGSHFQFRHSWDTYLSVQAVKRARSDIKSFCQSLLVELRKHSDHLHLSFDAFEGSLASGAGTSTHG